MSGQKEIVKVIALPFPFLKSTQNLVISRCSFARTAKKYTKKRDARAELLFWSLKVLRFDVAVAVAFLVS